jgi:hypothetical protein
MSKRKASPRIDCKTSDGSKSNPDSKTIPGATSGQREPTPRHIAVGDRLVEAREDMFVCAVCSNRFVIDWDTAWVDCLYAWLEQHGGNCYASATVLGR